MHTRWLVAFTYICHTSPSIQGTGIMIQSILAYTEIKDGHHMSLDRCHSAMDTKLVF